MKNLLMFLSIKKIKEILVGKRSKKHLSPIIQTIRFLLIRTYVQK